MTCWNWALQWSPKFVRTRMCVRGATGNLSNHDRGLVRVREASCLFKFNDLVCVYACVWVPSPPSLQPFELVGIQNSKLPPFLPHENTPTVICFSYQPCLGGHFSSPGATKQFPSLYFKKTRQTWSWHGGTWTLFTSPSVLSGEDFETNLEGGQSVQVQVRLRYWHPVFLPGGRQCVAVVCNECFFTRLCTL